MAVLGSVETGGVVLAGHWEAIARARVIRRGDAIPRKEPGCAAMSTEVCRRRHSLSMHETEAATPERQCRLALGEPRKLVQLLS